MEEGLYRSEYEHDACGVGMVVNIKGNKTHELVAGALKVLENMRHRGAEGADGKTGDGAGIMVQIPHEFILLQGIPVPEKGSYGTGLVFLSKDSTVCKAALDTIASEAESLGLELMHIREVPTNPACLGEAAAAVEPEIRQIFVTSREYIEDADLEMKLYRLRKHVEKKFPNTEDCYICSLSTKNIVYKGMLTSQQLSEYYCDLTSPWFTSGLAIVHSRFSTNTFPRWCLAQPFRFLAHNGEINTIRGNRSWMKARESTFNGGRLGDISDMTPLIQEGMSDSASLDNALEFFTASGLGLAQAMSMLVPESFNQRNPLSEDIRAFYEYHSILMAPWDGPSALFFSDGRYAGGALDRNGLRPARYVLTKKNTMIVASEAGVLDLDPSQIAEKGRLEPGKMILIDTQEGKILHDQEIKETLAAEFPYRKWLENNRIQLENLKNGRKILHSVRHYDMKLKTFGFTKDEIEKMIKPMCQTGTEPTAAMGCDTPLAVLNEKPQSFFNYFRQQFAQVTNPPIDSIREELVMSLSDYIGRVGTGILQPSETNCKMIRLPHPVLTNTKLDILAHLAYKGFRTVKVPMLFPLPAYESRAAKGESIEYALRHLCEEVERRVDEGYNYIILSDRDVDLERVPIPSLLAVSAVHHYLIEKGKRSQTAIIVEGGDIKETMHIALLLGFGASAVNPYMVYAVINEMVQTGAIQMNYAAAKENYIAAINKGLLKIMAKMGISTIKSYRGAKIFEAVGLSDSLLQKYFGIPSSTVGGIGLDRIERDTLIMYRGEYDPDEKEFHGWNPHSIRLLQKSVREGDYETFKAFSETVDSKETAVVLRDCLDFRKADKAIPIDEVESEDEIIRHFVVGAMSFGALSKEAHETLCLAVNKLGTRSNTGEGGEDSARYKAKVDGVSLSSKVKQVASGRFGVTAEYLANAEEIQIKVAQGAKPGEGGQLPGFKVDAVIAKTRHSTLGVSLISPPPHHDIYSIEDLAQLIFDLRNVNPKAIISVKLVSESGVGTVAAGVAKAKADLLVISGADGGTGASPASSIKYAGIPAEIGLAEAQQALMKNGLRSHVRLQTDGQIKTGRDVIILSLLGAEEFGFGTLPMIAMGCVMCRRCNTNTCATGICTQDPECRARFKGTPDHVMNLFRYLAREVRTYLAEMGARTLQEIVGRTDLLIQKKTDPEQKCSSLDFSRLLFMEPSSDGKSFESYLDNGIGNVLDTQIIKAAQPAIEWKDEISLDYPIGNTDRATGTMLSGKIAARYGDEGLPDGTINVKFVGSAGQSFAAFLCKGVNFRLEGETNDYFCKGLSGGVVSIIPPARCSFKAEENMIAGNTGLYGATSGEVYVNGRVGQRFAVRNSGAVAVVEGVGDHCCEYMTGGRVVVLGKVGRNFAAGMSGGIAYVLDENHDFDYWCNMDLVELSLVEKKADIDELYGLLRAHVTHTGSRFAKEILADWDNWRGKFLKVIPSEYRKLLEEGKDNS